MRASLLGLVAALCLSAGCASAFTSAKDDLRNGDAASARQRLVAIESETRSWSEHDRAEYALERGLAHLSLGDRDAAKVWLRRADDAVRAQPDVLSEQNRTRLRLGLESVSFPKP